MCPRKVRGRSEVLPPVAVADQAGPSGAFFRVAGAEIPPEDRLNSEDLEKVGRDVRDCHSRRLRTTRNGPGAVIVLRDRLEAAVLIAKIVEVGVRKMCPPTLGVDLKDGHDST